VLQSLQEIDPGIEVVTVSSSQHTDLLYPFVQLFGLRLDHDLKVMRPNQTPSEVCARVLQTLDPVLERERPDLVLVQGDTTTAFAGALAAFHRQIPVGHVEAGLRSGNALSPFPEEMNRRLATRLATYHFAATGSNRRNLLAEGVPEDSIFVTGNPVVDALKTIASVATPSPQLQEVLQRTRDTRLLVVTTHRRESFGHVLTENLQVLRRFVDAHPDVTLTFPVHPNPAVAGPAAKVLGGCDRIHLLAPLDYSDFIALLARAWLVVSDSGGVQEEAPSLGKPLLVLRENTERPEGLEAGVSRLVGGRPERLAQMLDEVYTGGEWSKTLQSIQNPFGDGRSGSRIARIISGILRGTNGDGKNDLVGVNTAEAVPGD
jgi:UDP-N-acetylglucosamine 2-epimerase (non-hydrolysing)